MNHPPAPLPNFFIAGAPNTGTTSLYFYLQQHPQVYMSPVKEPTYFGAAEFFAQTGAGDPIAQNRTLFLKFRAFMKRSERARSWDEYVALFRNAGDRPAVGEASPRYLLLPAAAGAMYQRIPHARIVFLLRDPAEWLLTRYLSRFWPDTQGSFRTRFRAALEPHDPWAAAVAVPRYGTHLQRFYDVFPREQLRIYLHEDLRRDARGVMRDLLTFVGVDPSHPLDLSRRHNPTVVPRLRSFDMLRHGILRDVALLQWLPGGVRRALRRMYHRPRPDLTMEPADRAMVIDHYRDEILRAADLIGRDLSAWLR